MYDGTDVLLPYSNLREIKGEVDQKKGFKAF